MIDRLIAASASGTFDEARTEWGYRGEFLEEDELTKGFQPTCDLCGPKELMKRNYLIHNTINGHTLRVGSICVQRFLILAGASTHEDSMAQFDRRTALGVFGRTYNFFITDLADDQPPERSAIALRDLLTKHFGGPISATEASLIVNAAGIGDVAADRFILLATGQPIGVRLRPQRDYQKERARVKHVLLVGVGRSKSRL